ncbi:MAG TPA: FAD-dependent oxidoreductase [Patescibacteria group bacterium]|nr:FAD-dependent oxidoreductase [Patescibacteria group bacterium]
MPKAGKTIVVLGGGIGGVVAAHELRKRLTKEHRVILVERRNSHLYQPLLLWIAIGLRNPKDSEIDYSSFAKKRIEVFYGDITSIDPVQKKIETSNGPLSFNFAIIALGADTHPEDIPGLNEFGFSFYDLAGAAKMHSALDHFTKSRIVILVSRLPYKCPAAPYEMAFLIEDIMRYRGIRKNISISFYTPEPQPLPATGSLVGGYALSMLQKKGIQFFPNENIREITEGKLHFESGREDEFDLLIAVPPHRAPAVIAQSPLAGPRGWIPVDPKTLQTKFDNIYAVGDCTEILLENGKMLPKAGMLAHLQAETAAHNIVLDILGRLKERETFTGFGACFLETGGGRASYISGHFYASPNPKVRIWRPSALTRWAKVFFAGYWKWKWF